jgi:hypothetical protein
VVGDFNTLSPIDRSSRQKNNKETLKLNDTIDQMDLTDCWRIIHPATAQYTFFSEIHVTFSKICHILGYKASLNKYNKTEIIPFLLPNCNAIKLELNTKGNTRKYSNTQRPNNTLFHDQWIIKEIGKISKCSWNLMIMKAQPIRTYRT